MVDPEIEAAVARLIAWATAETQTPCADPLDRLVLVEGAACRKYLHTVLARPDPQRRALTRPLAISPRLLPPP